MLGRWIIRIVAIFAFIGAGTVVNAQSKAGGGGASGGNSGGGNSGGSGVRTPGGGSGGGPPTRARDGGGSKSDAPAQSGGPKNDSGSAPARSGNDASPPRSGGGSAVRDGGGNSSSTVQPNPGRGTGAQPGGSSYRDGAGPQVTQPPPRTAEEGRQRAERDRAAQDQRRRTGIGQPGNGHTGIRQPDRTITVGPPHLNTWAPYSWWYSGTSYWWPDQGFYRDNDNDRDDPGYRNAENTPAPSVPSVPAPSGTAVTPTQAQAQTINALEAMPEFRQLQTELGRAQAEYDRASAKALEGVKASPEYQKLVKQREQADNEVEAVQASSREPNPARVTPAAEEKLNISAQVTKMEQDAIAADPQASAARARVMELTDKVTTLRRQAQGGAAR